MALRAAGFVLTDPSTTGSAWIERRIDQKDQPELPLDKPALNGTILAPETLRCKASNLYCD